jgi:hypothetical protein
LAFDPAGRQKGNCAAKAVANEYDILPAPFLDFVGQHVRRARYRVVWDIGGAAISETWQVHSHEMVFLGKIRLRERQKGCL